MKKLTLLLISLFSFLLIGCFEPDEEDLEEIQTEESTLVPASPIVEEIEDLLEPLGIGIVISESSRKNCATYYTFVDDNLDRIHQEGETILKEDQEVCIADNEEGSKTFEVLYTIVEVEEPTEGCSDTSFIINIGFDINNNGVLDNEEISTKHKHCNTIVEETEQDTSDNTPENDPANDSEDTSDNAPDQPNDEAPGNDIPEDNNRPDLPQVDPDEEGKGI